MKHTVTKNSETKVTLSITVDATELAESRKLILPKLSKQLKVAGFRPGKVPADVAEKHIDQNALNAEVLEEAVNKSAIEALTIAQLQPLDRPKVEVTKYVPGEMLEFTAEVEILPEVKLADYKKLKATKEKAVVTAKDIEEVIERLQKGMATKNTVERAAKDGDEVLIDFDGKDEHGKAVGGAQGNDYPLALGSDTFIPGFEAGLLGKKAGDEFDLPLTFPKDYHHKPLAGAKVIFGVKVKEVKAIELPKVDAEFAAKCGPFKTVEELKADVKRELTDQKEREALEKLKDSLAEQLVKGSKIPVPELLVTDQIANLEQDVTQNLLYRGQTLQQYLDEQKLTKEEWQEKELRPKAVRRIEVGLALAELSKLENIQITQEQLDARLAQMLQEYGNSPEIIKQLDTPEAKRDIANRLITEKTVERLVELNSK